MFNKNKKIRSIESTGDGVINNTGDGVSIGATYHIYHQPKFLNSSILYDFCVEFSKIEFELHLDDDPQTPPSDIEEKITFNEIDVYKDIFQDCEQYYDDVEEILKEVPNRQKIIKNINQKYKKIKKFEEWVDKDQLCQLMFQDLYNILANVQNKNVILEEDANLSIHAIMYYAFVKCKLLDPVPQTK